MLGSRLMSAQDFLVEQTYLGSKTKAELFAVFFQFVDYDIDLYKITYKTTDVHNQPDTASGLLVLPKVPDTTLLPLVVFAHGTTSGPEDVPSRLQGGYEGAMAYAAFGFATVAPDFLGLGDARGFHPYLHAATQASASLDAIFAAHEFLEFNDPDIDPQYLFLGGYSQGGHVSMALHQEIDNIWSVIIPVTAATHMSGPYSISGIMRDRILSDMDYGFPAYIAYIFLGYNEAYGLYENVEQVFKQPFATSIQSFYEGAITLDQLNSALLNALAPGGDMVPKRMLQDSVLNGLANDLSHPLNAALRDNDTYNFAPEAPTRLYYCGADEQVPARNSIVADSVMNALGAADTEAINLNPNFNHGLCAISAITNSIDFFRSFLNTVSSEDIARPAITTVFPNPATSYVDIQWAEAAAGCHYSIMDNEGKMIQSGHASSNRIPVYDLPSGMYTLICKVDKQSRVARIIHL